MTQLEDGSSPLQLNVVVNDSHTKVVQTQVRNLRVRSPLTPRPDLRSNFLASLAVS